MSMNDIFGLPREGNTHKDQELFNFCKLCGPIVNENKFLIYE